MFGAAVVILVVVADVAFHHTSSLLAGCVALVGFVWLLLCLLVWLLIWFYLV